jgi:hypothetical protein
MNINGHRTKAWRETARVFLIALFLLAGHATTQGQNRAQQNAGAGAASRSAAANTPTSLDIIRPRDLDRWMYARIAWAVVFGGLAGFLLSWLYLTKISYGGGLETERKARRIFLVCLFFIVLPAVLLLLYADMYFYSFIGYVAFTLLGALFGLQALLMTASALLAFTVAAAFTARHKPWSRCPYMLWPKPKGS